MHNLLVFLSKYSYALLFVMLEAVSMWLLVCFNSYQGSVGFTAANSVVAHIGEIYSSTVAYMRLESVNREITRKNIALQAENEALQQALLKATRDTTLTERIMREKLAGYSMVDATVVSNSMERSNNYLVIDCGEEDGIKPEMGVVGGGGVVGIVYLTGPRHSLVIPVTNRKSSISCRIRGQNYFGYLQWDGSSMVCAYVDDVPRYAKVKRGDIVETSGYSAVFPPGIFVGRIRSIRNSSDGQSYRLDITLGTNFANLRDVAVVTTPYKAEIDTLQARAANLSGAGQ